MLAKLKGGCMENLDLGVLISALIVAVSTVVVHWFAVRGQHPGLRKVRELNEAIEKYEPEDEGRDLLIAARLDVSRYLGAELRMRASVPAGIALTRQSSLVLLYVGFAIGVPAVIANLIDGLTGGDNSLYLIFAYIGSGILLVSMVLMLITSAALNVQLARGRGILEARAELATKRTDGAS